MESIEDIKADIRSRTVVSYMKNHSFGGQHVTMIPRGMIVENTDVGVRIEMNAYRSQYVNREKALLLLDLIIDDVIK